MSFSRPPSRINPKVSTMPRQQSESAHYLDVYKLTIEKRRLRQELESLDKRRERIQTRLDALEQQIHSAEGKAQQYREAPPTVSDFPSAPNSIIYPPMYGGDRSTADSFKTLTLDY